ncbi:MAG: TAXI family TRAP transporter solute-binding subunit [Xenococcaceae cyanobacterium]
MQNKLVLPVVLLSIVMACTFAVEWFREQNRGYYLTIATGGKNGEYYAFAKALAQVVAKHQPQIQIEVLETEGSLQNEEFLEQNRVQLALLQSDTPVNPSTRAIAFLFPEMFHLIAAANSDIQSVSDLKGKRIALMPKGSGSYKLFWPLSKHYGLSETDFEPMVLPPEQAHAALRQGQVDALFRVIALGNPAVSQLLQTSQTRLVPIDQAAALQLFQPALETSQIPKGTYNGAIPIPAEDLPVVAVRAVLVTHEDIDESVIHEITRILFEARNELVKQNPQAAMIRQPDSIRELGLAFHPGAKAYYNQDEPSFIVSFIVKYAEPMGLLLSISVLGVSGIWQLRLWLQGRQKNRTDLYNLEILRLIDEIDSIEDLEQLAVVRRHLFEIFEKVVVDLDQDRISPESFQSFTFPWEVAVKAIRHREMLLMNLRPPAEIQKESSSKKQQPF